MTTATAWVRRGVAAQLPEKYEIDETEMNRISTLARKQLEDAQAGLAAAQEEEDEEEEKEGTEGKERKEETAEKDNGKSKGKGKKAKKEAGREADAEMDVDGSADKEGDDDDLAEYDLDHYDSDAVDEDGEPVTMFGNVKALAYHAPNEEDPYLVVPENGADDDDDERAELEIRPTDNLLLAARVEDEVAHLEVYVYEDEADNLYVHHDIMLPAIPLALEWIDLPVGRAAGARETGNFVTVGTMEPEIEVWDLDVVDCMYPAAILGQADKDVSASKKKRKKAAGKKANDTHHVDAVLSLAANCAHRNLLASGSADTTIKLWDLNNAGGSGSTPCAQSYSRHTDKVSALDWHPTQSTVLLSGSYDGTAVVADMRAPDATAATRWAVGAGGVEVDIEAIRWDMHSSDGSCFFAATDGGQVCYYDARAGSGSKPVWTLQAHDEAVSALDVNAHVPGLVATGSTADKTIKLWDVAGNSSGGPTLVVARNVADDIGRIFSATFAPDPSVAFRLAVAGSRGTVSVWDTSTNGATRRTFAGRAHMDPERAEQGAGAGADRMVGVAGDEEEEGEEDGGVGVDGGEGGVPRDGWESMDEEMDEDEKSG